MTDKLLQLGAPVSIRLREDIRLTTIISLIAAAFILTVILFVISPPKLAIYEWSLPFFKSEKERTISKNAWLAWWSPTTTTASFEKAAAGLGSVSPVWYRLTADGRLSEIHAQNKSDIREIAADSGVLLWPTITNDDGKGFNPESVSLLLQDRVQQDLLIKYLLTTAKEENYTGWDIDWEKIKEEDKDAYSQFIARLSQELHKKNLKVSVAVHAKAGTDHDWVGAKGQDWEALSASVDEMRIMAYDYHHLESGPGAITPLVWLESVLHYAKKTIPNEKTVLGLPLYGYEWTDEESNTLEYTQAVKKIADNNGTVTRDQITQEVIGTYTRDGKNYTMWYQDKKSIEAKLRIAEKFSIKKVIFWKLGGEDESVWKL